MDPYARRPPRMALPDLQAFEGQVRLIRERSRVKFYWVHLSWMAYVVLWMLLHWWGIWDYRGVEFQSFFGFLALVAPSLTFVLVAFLITPTLPPEGDLDLRDYYARTQRWVFPLAALILLELSGLRMLLTEEALLHPRNGVRLLAVAGAVWLAVSRDARVHATLVILSFVGAVIYGLTRPHF